MKMKWKHIKLVRLVRSDMAKPIHYTHSIESVNQATTNQPNLIQTRKSKSNKICTVFHFATLSSQWSHVQLLRVLERMQIFRWMEIITGLFRLWDCTNFMATEFMAEPHCWLPTHPSSHTETFNVDSVRWQPQGRRTFTIVEWLSKVVYISFVGS